MFDEVQFPPAISYGSMGGPAYSTAVFRNDAGTLTRVARRETPLHRYGVTLGIKASAEMAAVVAFFHARQGPLRGFRWKDWSDYSSAADGQSAPTNADVNIGAGDGSEVDFQLVKKYASGVSTLTRPITKPVSGSVVVAVNAVAKTEGVDFTVDTTTGVVTFTVAPTAGHAITAGFQFDVPVVFGEDSVQVMHRAYDGQQIDNLPIEEIPEPGLEVVDDFPMGGWHYYGDTAVNVNHSFGNGRGVTYNPTTSGVKIILPDETSVANGGPHGYIRNESAVDTLGLYASDGVTLIKTIATETMVEIVKRLTPAGNRTWDAI